jgi:nucleoside-diphosphate-sugar epimerase
VEIHRRTIIGGESRLGIFQILFEWISEGRNIYVIGDGTNLFQFVHVDDLIDASIKAAFSDKTGLYNIGTDQYKTLRENLDELIFHAGTSSQVKNLPVGIAKFVLHIADALKLSPLAPWHYLTYHKPFVFDISKAIRELEWKPKYSNIEALIESYDWYLLNKERTNKELSSTHKSPVKQGLLRLLKYFS